MYCMSVFEYDDDVAQDLALNVGQSKVSDVVLAFGMEKVFNSLHHDDVSIMQLVERAKFAYWVQNHQTHNSVAVR